MTPHSPDSSSSIPPAPPVPETFKYLLVASALFIASVSAFFSVQGLGYLFAGSAMAVMIMAASLEVGKLVAASYLSRYWNRTHRVLKLYLVLAVLVLIAITSLGNYGYLARAYERTHTQIVLLENQIASLEREIGDTQRQIEGAKSAVTLSTANSREDVAKLEQRLAANNESLNQSLARLQERRKAAQERRDRDVQAVAQRLKEQGEVSQKAIAIEEAASAVLNERMAALDRAGGPVLTTEEAAITALNERLAVLDRAPGPVVTTEETAIAALNDRMAAISRAPGPVVATEEAAIAALNERVAVLDRAVDAYTKQGGPGFFKIDSIKKGQELREQQRKVREAIAAEMAEHLMRIEQIRAAHAKQLAQERDSITSQLSDLRARIEQIRVEHSRQMVKARETAATELSTHRTRIEQLRTEHAKRQAMAREALVTDQTEARARIAQQRAAYAKQVEAADRDVTAVRDLFAQESARLDAEEQAARRAGLAANEEVEKQLASLKAQGQATTAGGDTQTQSLYQRIRTRNEDISRLRAQIAAVDIGSYRFIARAFDATADGVVKWLMLALVLVFDPLAVSLVIGFNIALLARPAAQYVGAELPAAAEPTAAGSSKRMALSAGVYSAVAATIALGLAGVWGAGAVRTKLRAAHGSLIPGESFAVMSFRPGDISRAGQGETFTDLLGKAGGKSVSDTLASLMTNGFDPDADLYAFAKFPAKASTEAQDRPVMLCGFVARVTDGAAVETALSRIADQVSLSLRTASNAAPSRARSRAMIRHGSGRYMDPEGGFFSFALTGQAAVVLIELEGNPRSPCLEEEIRLCLAPPAATATGLGAEAHEQLPPRARSRDGALSLWFDAARFCHHLPKNPAAQARYQQLEKHLGFELLLAVRPAADNQLSLVADYAYQHDRFKDLQPVTPLQVLTDLGTADTAGLGGRLMDRCMDTLDYDSLIERLRTAFGGTNSAAAQRVLIEKSFASTRDASFTLTAQYGPQAGSPLLAAMQMLFQ